MLILELTSVCSMTNVNTWEGFYIQGKEQLNESLYLDFLGEVEFR